MALMTKYFIGMAIKYFKLLTQLSDLG